MKSYSKEDLIWLAGFIDGEGYVAWTKRDKRPSFRFEIRVSNTNLMALTWIHQHFGGYLYQLNKATLIPHRKACYQWWMADKKAKELYEQLKPYLKIK